MITNVTVREVAYEMTSGRAFVPFRRYVVHTAKSYFDYVSAILVRTRSNL